MGSNLDYAGRPVKLKDKLYKYIVMGAISVAGAVFVSNVAFEAYQSKPVNSLTDRLEKAYQTCQEIKDKSQSVDFAHFFNVPCQEVENLYLKVKK